MFGSWLFGRRVTYTKVSRPMTPAEEKAFDKVFETMDQTFKAMHEFFDVARSARASPPPRSGNTNEGAKGSNHG
jgi:hypothetical protein